MGWSRPFEMLALREVSEQIAAMGTGITPGGPMLPVEILTAVVSMTVAEHIDHVVHSDVKVSPRVRDMYRKLQVMCRTVC